MADFCLVSQRTLEDLENRIFRHHFLLGADWKICCRQLHIDRGTFFHLVYSIQNRLGRVFAELTPYPIYPVAEYFSGATRCRHQAGPPPRRPETLHFTPYRLAPRRSLVRRAVRPGSRRRSALSGSRKRPPHRFNRSSDSPPV
jgi:hypothetical protein